MSSRRTNPFYVGDYVRVVIEARITEASDTWDDSMGYLNLDVPGDTLYFEKKQIKSIEKITPPFVFPKGHATLSGHHYANGQHRVFFFVKQGQWATYDSNGDSSFWGEQDLASSFPDLKVEWVQDVRQG